MTDVPFGRSEIGSTFTWNPRTVFQFLSRRSAIDKGDLHLLRDFSNECMHDEFIDHNAFDQTNSFQALATAQVCTGNRYVSTVSLNLECMLKQPGAA